jgi:hypothetical protein
MSKPTVSAAGGAMPAEGQNAPSLLNIAESLDQTRSLIVAASNLAAAIDDTQGQGLHAVILAAEEKFGEAHDWFLDRYSASPTSEPTSSPADPDPSRELLSIADEIDEVRYLIDAAWMAAGELAKEECNPIKAVLDIAERKLTAARDRLNVARTATPADPIFAAIERHKTAWGAYVEATCKLTMPELDAYREAHDDDSGKALEEFLATPPTTLAGLRAALEYAVEFDSGCKPDTGGRIAETLLRSPLFAGMKAEGLDDV